MRLELLRQPLMSAIGFGYDQQARRVLVDAVDDAWACHSADPGQPTLTMMKQRIDQGSVQIARGRMDHQAGGLVDDDQVGIFMDDVEWYVLCSGLSRDRRGQDDGEGLSGCDLH